RKDEKGKLDTDAPHLHSMRYLFFHILDLATYPDRYNVSYDTLLPVYPRILRLTKAIAYPSLSAISKIPVSPVDRGPSYTTCAGVSVASDGYKRGCHAFLKYGPVIWP